MRSRRSIPFANLVAPLSVGVMMACGGGLGPSYGGGGTAGANAHTGGTGAINAGGTTLANGGRTLGGAAARGGSGAVATGGGTATATGGTGTVGSLVNTAWTMTTNCSGCCLGTFTFLSGGLFTSTCSYSGPLAWSQSGTTVIFSVNDDYATFTGTINGNQITGTALNQDGTTWSFGMTRA
jgi:hypothetical protein